MIKQLTI